MSNSLRPHGLQHARLPCPSLSLKVCSNSCPLSQWCHPTISSCHPLLFLSSIFPSIRVFSNESVIHIRWPKYYSFCIIPSNEHSRLISFRIDSLIFLLSKGLSRVFSSTRDPKALILWHSTFFVVQLSHPYMTTGKTITQTRWTFSTVWKGRWVELTYSLFLPCQSPDTVRVKRETVVFKWSHLC